MAATNRLPQVADTVVTYVGDLDNSKWVSLVDSTLNSNNPCVEGSVAAGNDIGGGIGGADDTHTSALLAASGAITPRISP